MQEPTPYQLAVLRALQGKKVYEGTVGVAERARRRERNRVAKASRKINRGRR